jgi:peptidoglycan hydrolase CwlO-like protein
MDSSTIAAYIAALVAAFCGVMTYRASTRANNVASRSIDQEGFDRALKWRDEELSRVTQQAERMSNQINKISDQLASEQDVSNALRNQVRTLQGMVDTLKQQVEDLRDRSQGRMLHPLPIVPQQP